MRITAHTVQLPTPRYRCNDNYQPHDFNKDNSKSKFTVAITDDFSLDSTISNTAGPNGGIFMDTTHRLQNENRVATTVLCTANKNLRMTPERQGQFRRKCGASELMDSIAEAAESLAEDAAVNMRKLKWSSTTRSKGYTFLKTVGPMIAGWLRATIEKIVARAKEVAQVLKELGIEDDVFIRLCQFHVIQAILHFDCDDRRRGLGFMLPLERCRSWDQSEATKYLFYDELKEILREVDAIELQDHLEDDSSSDDEAIHRESAKQKTAKQKPPPKPRTKRARASGLTSGAYQVALRARLLRFRDLKDHLEASLYPDLDHAPTPGHNTVIQYQVDRVRERLNALIPADQRHNYALVAKAGPSMFWVLTMAYLTGCDDAASYAALKNGGLERELCEAERILEVYNMVCFDEDMDRVAKISVPGLEVPDPYFRDYCSS
ncbi:hypothetical protein C8J57DRAFT_1239953 [Mycena rebaudengoi]|nr:hypothetical protein C8J57DRAFT_1239953 [Mycena rebaudengoi]